MKIIPVSEKEWEHAPSSANGKYAELRKQVSQLPYGNHLKVDFDNNKEKTLGVQNLSAYSKKENITLKYKHPSKTTLLIWKMPV